MPQVKPEVPPENVQRREGREGKKRRKGKNLRLLT